MDAIGNMKHKANIAAIYSTGLRSSKVINLQKRDVDFDKNIIFIRGAKGKKDLISSFLEISTALLKLYIQKYKANY